MPATVQAIYASQLDDLPASARVVARRASVAGRRFARQALEPLEVREPEDGIGHLQRRAFIRGPEPDATSGDTYTFRHALLRDAGYASLSRVERHRYHVALAIWLEQTAGADLGRVAEPIASHYEAALASMPGVGGDADARSALTDHARHWLERAAEEALGVAAHEAAIGLLARAVRLAGSDALEAARLRLRRGELLAATGDLADGMAEMEAALGTFRADFLSGGGGPTRDQARTGYGGAVAALGDAMIEQLRFIEAHDLVARALDDLAEQEDELVGRLLALHAWAQVAQGDRDGTVDEAERALELARGGDPWLELEVRYRRARVRSESLPDTRSEWAEVEGLARSLGSWGMALRARSNLLLNVQDDGQPRALLAQLHESLELAISHGLTQQACWSRYNIVDLLLRLGDWDDALETGLANIEIAERNSYHRPTFRTWMAMLPILSARGEPEALQRCAAWLRENRAVFPDPPSAYAVLHGRATDSMYERAGLSGPFGRSIEPEAIQFDAYGNTDYVAAIEAIVWGWLADGVPADRLRPPLSVLRGIWEEPGGPPADAVMQASMELMDAWGARATDGEAATTEITALARQSASHGRAGQAPWWVVRALRAIPEDVASAEELAEADAIEEHLRVPRNATAPPA
jgi:tetratricopeptide (TPR) repeat protein